MLKYLIYEHLKHPYRTVAEIALLCGCIWLFISVVKAYKSIRADEDRARKIDEENESYLTDFKPTGSHGTSLDRLKSEQKKFKNKK